MSLNQSFISHFSEYSLHINCTIVDVWGDVLRPPHGTTPKSMSNGNKNNTFVEANVRNNSANFQLILYTASEELIFNIVSQILHFGCHSNQSK